MMLELKVNVDETNSLGLVKIKTQTEEQIINKTQSFFFEKETDVELICEPISSEYELVEVVNSSNFFMKDECIIHHLIKVNESKEVQPIFRKRLKTIQSDVGHINVKTNLGGEVNIKSNQQNFQHCCGTNYVYPVFKNTYIKITVEPNDGYEISSINTNYENFKSNSEVLFEDTDAWIEVKFERETEKVQKITNSRINNLNIELKNNQELTDVDNVKINENSNKLQCNLKMIHEQIEYGKVILKTKEKQIEITKKNCDFNFDKKTKIELICTPKTTDVELVEVVNSYNFYMKGNSAHHFIDMMEDIEVIPVFRKKIIKKENHINYIRINTNGGGTVNIIGDNLFFSHNNSGNRLYPIDKNSLIEIELISDLNYEVLFIKSNYQKYQTGEKILFEESDAWVEVRFEKVVSSDTQNLDNKILLNNDSDSSSKLITTAIKDNLIVENISKPDIKEVTTIQSKIKTRNVIFNTFEFNFTPKHSPDLHGWYTCNGNLLHNLVLHRGNTYKFTTLHDRTSFELLNLNNEMYSDEITKNPVFSLNNDFEFTPNEQTPSKLLLRTRHRQDKVITISIMNGHYYGNVSSASFLKESDIDIKTKNGNIIKKSNNLGENIINNQSQILHLDAKLGIDQVTGIINNLKYSAMIGSTQINPLTTVVVDIYKTQKYDICQINNALSKSLDIKSYYDICTDNVVHNILNGDTSYFKIHKIHILIDAMLNISNEFGVYDKFKKILAKRFMKDRLVLFNGDEFLNETFGKLLYRNDQYSLNSLVEFIKNLFSFVINTDNESSFYNWYKLFAFHYVFHTKFLPYIKNTEKIQADWKNFGGFISDAFSEISKVKIPSELVLVECDVCRKSTKSFNTLLDHMKFTLNNEIFSKILKYEYAISENTLKHIYNKILKISFISEQSCYIISNNPVNYYGNLKSVDTYEIEHDFSSLPECIDAISIDDSNEIIEGETEEECFNFSLVESGNSKVMLSKSVKRNELLIESLGKGEFRIYLDEVIGSPDTERTGPGYIKIPKQYAVPMQQHYIRVGYKSGIEKKPITKIINNEKNVRVITTYWSTKLKKLVCIVATPIHINENNEVEFVNSSNSELDGVYLISDVLTPTAFVVDLRDKVGSENYDDISSTVLINSGVKVYCSTQEYAVGDGVLFAGHKDYPQTIKQKSSDEFGDFIVVNEKFSQIPKFLIKSHAIENRDLVNDFMFTNKQIYYETTDSDYIEDRLWLTYDPDTDPDGRLHQKISYIEIFYNKDF